MIAAAILTGGQARRFSGRDKSRLVTEPGGLTILERQLSMLAPLVSETLIVTSALRLPDFAGVAGGRAVADAYPGTGPLGAILTALDAADAEAIFVLGGDMPGVPAALVSALARRHEAGGHDVTAPASVRGLEPLAAIYSRAARAGLLRALMSGDLSLQQALRGLRLDVMPAPDVAAHGDPDRLFRNINAPRDLM